MPFFMDVDLMSSGVLERFDEQSVPSGGWHVQDEIKCGTFFVQGRNKFYWYATSGPREEFLVKVPGDVDSRSNKFMPSGRHSEHVTSPPSDLMYPLRHCHRNTRSSIRVRTFIWALGLVGPLCGGRVSVSLCQKPPAS